MKGVASIYWDETKEFFTHVATILSLFPSNSLPDVLCDPTDLIWRRGTPFEAMTGRTAPSSDVS